MDSQIPNPRVVDEYYYVQRPYVMYQVWVRGEDFLARMGIGFSKCEVLDHWDEQFGRKLARRRAIADAERNYHLALADVQYEQRMREAKQLVNERYPKPKPFDPKPYTYSSADFLKQWLPIHDFTDDDSAEIARDDDES